MDMAPTIPTTDPTQRVTKEDLGYLDTSNEVVADYDTTELRGDTDILASQATSKVPFGDWRDEFFHKGYHVIKRAIPRERADNYRQRMMEWFGKFDFGLDMNDKSTWVQKHLPKMMKGGVILNYCAAHEKWAWELRRSVDCSIKHLRPNAPPFPKIFSKKPVL